LPNLTVLGMQTERPKNQKLRNTVMNKRGEIMILEKPWRRKLAT
jgi:hypothetical protein